MSDNFQSYYQAVKFLESLANIRDKHDYLSNRKNPQIYLNRIKYLLRLLNNPDKKFKFIHVGGTAGKGSVTALLHEILLASGKRVGSFYSPFPTTSIEKIRVNNKYIAAGELANIVEYLKPFLNRAYQYGPGGGPSYFEIFLALALVYFQKKKCEWVILEVGLGGRYDATNIIAKPKLTAITNINFDHTDLLGSTLKKIAKEKLGIVKTGAPLFTTENRQQLLKIFQGVCQKNKTQLHLVENIIEQTKYQNKTSQVYIKNFKAPIKTYLLGEEQKMNISLATKIAKYLNIPDKFISQGISKARLSCRFEIMQKDPQVVLDVAHCPVKMKSTQRNLKHLSFKKLILVIALAANKDADKTLKTIVPEADYIFATRFEIIQRKCLNPVKLAKYVKKCKKKGAKLEINLSPHQALKQVLKIANKKDLILVTGSFFLVGELRQYWYPEEYILKKLNSW